MGIAQLCKSEAEDALQSMQQEKYEILRLVGLALVNHELGQTETSSSLLTELIENFEQDAAYNIAYVLAFKGEIDQAFEWLDKARLYSDPGLVDILGEPMFQNLQADPRWLPFLESIGKSPEQLSAIRFNVDFAKAQPVS